MVSVNSRMTQPGSIQLREGDLVAGKYRIQQVLGVGGMGVVVAARHEELDQLVAIKFVRDDALGNDEAVERFLREARSAAKLKSEYVARVLDVGRLPSGAPYMVMEFLDGTDLAQTLTRDGPMAFDLAVGLMLQVCEAVAEAHAAGIVHRDLKPENLFLTRTLGGSPRMKVLDFGVSKSATLASGGKGLLTGTSAMLGSPLYMAPEQMRSSRDVDSRIDVWALGVVLFELLTRRSPFEADTMPELCLKVVSEPPLSLAQLRPDLPPALVGVVERCLEKERDKRYANAAELAAALEPFGPPRSNLFSGRLPPAGPSRLSGVLGGAPGSVEPPVVTPGQRSASGPAAWGTERRAESGPTGPRPKQAMVWIAAFSLGVAGAIAFFAFRRPAVSPGPASDTSSAPAASASNPAPPPPAEVAIAPSASSVGAEVASTTASALSAPSGDVSAAPTADAESEARAAAPVATIPRVWPQPTARPATGSTPQGLDDDIPALR
jgi:serine/threonine protein kinase